MKRRPHPAKSPHVPNRRETKLPPAPPTAPAWPARLVWALAGIYAAIFGYVSVQRFRYYLYGDFDLAIFSQATSGILRGSLFTSIGGTYWLRGHASLILFLIAPLYAIAHHPVTLLMLQTAALALGALSVYALARRRLGHAGAAVCFAALYLLYPAVGYTNLFEFHPETIATCTLLAALYCLEAGRPVPTLIFAALSLLTREDAALVVLVLAGQAVWSRASNHRWTGAGLAGLAVASLAFDVLVLRPAFLSGEADYALVFQGWGSTPRAMFLNMLHHPLRVVGSLFITAGSTDDSVVKLQYWGQMLLPVLGLPLLAPGRLLPALPVVLLHFLSGRSTQHDIVHQYTALVTPFVFAAAIAGFGRLAGFASRRDPAGSSERLSHALKAILAVALLAGVSAQALFGPLFGTGTMNRHQPVRTLWPTVADATLKPYRDRMVARAARAGSIVASYEFLARLSGLDTVHSYGHVYWGHYTFSERPYPIPRVRALLTSLGNERDSLGTARVEELVRVNRLKPVDSAGDLVLFEADPPDSAPLVSPDLSTALAPAAVMYDRQLAFLGCTLRSRRTAPGALLPLGTYWRRVGIIDRFYLLEFSLFDDREVQVAKHSRYLGYGTSIVERAPAGVRLREEYRLIVPRDVRPGTYTLVMRVGARRGPRPMTAVPDDPVLERLGGYLSLGTIEVGRNPGPTDQTPDAP